MADKQKIRSAISNEVRKYLESKPIDVVIDIGAYTGNYSIYYASYARRVYSIEACYDNFTKLVRGTEHLPNVHPELMAITGEDGFATLYIGNHKKSAGSSQANSIHREFVADKKWAGDVKESTLPSKTLASFLMDKGLDYVDLVKVNCEGGEYDMFKTPQHFDVLDKIGAISISFHGKHKRFAMQDCVSVREQFAKIAPEKGFKLVAGHKDMPSDTHMEQFWVKTK